jgi:hypothetical protein
MEDMLVGCEAAGFAVWIEIKENYLKSKYGVAWTAKKSRKSKSAEWYESWRLYGSFFFSASAFYSPPVTRFLALRINTSRLPPSKFLFNSGGQELQREV